MQYLQTIGNEIIYVLVIIFIVVFKYEQNKLKVQIPIDKTKSRDYEKYYDLKLIKEKLKQAKEEKVFIREKINFCVILSIIIFFFFYSTYNKFKFRDFSVVFLIQSIIFYGLIVYIFYSNLRKKEMTYAYKKIVLRAMLYEKYPTATYDAVDGISAYEYDKAFKKYSNIYYNFYSKDLIRYEAGNSNISLCLVKTTRDTTKFKSVINERVTFNGFVGYYELDKKFEIDRLYVGARKGQKIEVMDSEIFNNKFYASCNNKVALYKLLTPNNMERLLNLIKIIPTLELLLLDNRLYFRFRHPDILEHKKDVKLSARELYKFKLLMESLEKLCVEVELEINKKLAPNFDLNKETDISKEN